MENELKDKNPEPQNCWDFWDCPKEVRDECPAYKTNSGRECFFVAENFCPRLRKKEVEHCWQCPWYQKIKPELNKHSHQKE